MHAGAATELVRHPLRLRRLEVVAVERPTPRLVRVTLGGSELDGFPHGAPDDHVKVFFPAAGADEPVLPELGPDGVVWPTEGPRPIARDYTPGAVDPRAGTLQLDLVLHDGGHAAAWAAEAAPGAVLGVAGPRGSHVLRRRFEAFLLAGDETALPAIRNWCAAAPSGSSVIAYVEVADEADHQPLPSPGHSMVRWLHRGEAEPGTSTALVDAVARHAGRLGETFVWIAAEAGVVQRARAALASRGAPPPHLSARGYWKRGAPDHQEPHDD